MEQMGRIKDDAHYNNFPLVRQVEALWVKSAVLDCILFQFVFRTFVCTSVTFNCFICLLLASE